MLSIITLKRNLFYFLAYVLLAIYITYLLGYVNQKQNKSDIFKKIKNIYIKCNNV